MGIIDPHSEYSLYDVLNGDIAITDSGPEGSVDFYGFHITPTKTDGSEYIVTYDGHVGTVDRFSPDEFGDVLELVDRLMKHVFLAQEYDYSDDREALVEWAGKIITDDSERAEKNPDLYMTVPTRSPSDL